MTRGDGLPPRDQARLLAAVELVGRSGATGFEIGYDDDDPANVTWKAEAKYKGARVFVDDRPTPFKAAEDLARKILDGGLCLHCQRVVSIGAPSLKGCVWRRVDDHWQPGCQLEPLPPSPAPAERLDPDVDVEEAAASELLGGIVAPVLVRDYTSIISATGTRDGGPLTPTVIVRITGRVNNTPDEVSQTTLWSIEDTEAFGHLLLEQARIAREAGPPETWNQRR